MFCCYFDKFLPYCINQKKYFMLVAISKHWWSMLIRGLLLLLLGLIALFVPQLTAQLLVLYLGFMSSFLVLLFIYLGLRAKIDFKRRMVYLFVGSVDGVVAYYCLVETDFAASILLLLIGLWAVVMGLTIVVFGLQASGTSRVLMLINGFLSITLGFFLYFNPFHAENVNYMAGFYLVLLIIFLLYLGFKMREVYQISKKPMQVEESTSESLSE